MASRKPTATTESFDRARAATERARKRIAEQTGEATEIDFRTAPLSWWRERWADRAIRRLFIENFIKIRDLESKKLVLLKYNDMQDDLDERLTGKDANLKMRKGGSSTFFIAKKFANAVVLGGRTMRVFAHNPKTEQRFRRDIRTMHRHLPAHLRPTAKKTESGGLEWHDDETGYTTVETMGVQPGFEDNARGDDITDALITEMPYMRGDTQVALTAILEACTPDADITVESTAGGVETFQSVYQDGKHRGAVGLLTSMSGSGDAIYVSPARTSLKTTSNSSSLILLSLMRRETKPRSPKRSVSSALASFISYSSANM